MAPALASRWRDAEASFEGLLRGLGVDDETQTTEIVLRQVPINSAEQFVAKLAADTAGHNELWLHFTLTDGNARAGLALPIAKAVPPASASLGLYVEVHSRLIAWWLTYAWRAAQLQSASATLSTADQAIAAATCARALLETSAAFWVDARKFADIWSAAKAAGRPTLDATTVATRQRFIRHLNEVQYGGKFSDKAPEAAEVFGRQPRGNVLTAIDKLAKQSPADLHTDYQWLCNTVHPSLGTALVFSAPPLAHETGTHVQRWFAGVPLRIQALSDDSFDEEEFVDRSISAAIARASIAALDVLTLTMDATLRMIDDIGLTTGAPALADFAYWRALAPAGRNEPCRCRSGRKAKNCWHEWGKPAPSVPGTFLNKGESLA